MPTLKAPKDTRETKDKITVLTAVQIGKAIFPVTTVAPMPTS